MAIATPLGGDSLILRGLTLVEQLGQPFDVRADLLSTNELIKHEALLGKNVTARLNLDGNGTRFFNGYVADFNYAGQERAYVRYTATIKPWLWFLGKTSDCRIFQNETVPDIIRKVFTEQGFTDVDDRLSESYRVLEYCVQYRESDLNFVSRLMEQEGIYYYFRHEDGKHTMVLADGYASHEPAPGFASVAYYPPSSNLVREDHFSSWSAARSVQTGAAEMSDFDFKKPRADLTVRNIIEREHSNAGFTSFDYPGEYTELAEGDDLIRRRMEGIAARYERVRGSGNVRGIGAGNLYGLAEHPRADQNREYLAVNVQMQLTNNDIETAGGSSGGASISCAVESIEARTPFRPPHRASKVMAHGPQTAVVTGPEGEEIWADEFGRVKVQFHWDRYGKADESTSCWVRVSQASAGRGWGAITLPRIGQEVIVAFLEGDPDRPIITGRVYNADNMPPYELPANSTISTFKSNSSKGGQGFNEYRFEDKKGAEQIFTHAERDQDTRVKHDQREWVGNLSNRVVENDFIEHLKNDFHLTVDGEQVEHVKGTASLTVDQEQHARIGTNYAVKAGAEVHVKAGAQIVLEAGSSVTLKCGGSFINVTPSGIFGSAPSVNLNSGGSASSGAGASPSSPATPAVADDAEAGEIAEVAPVKHAEQDVFTAQAISVLKRAALDGTAFCEVCNAG